ncbi:glycoside/pentoside/hexuronide:cation symporter, GPH family [Arenibacter nanhaiticus]|uniref:Glycoside/pentoside/hexuronide:cation symporter, GPH family n=1 Tax=Arenibacter nanhaiticus TaxID=558155 RepID=A0A1M6C8A5_9FLAO|nr:glycoside-pentoside-hexuronide (GPH):cation symporter [Arenibacter nanhaiticus]SHI56968.1 glycoside/pentoside/hexuronide:cation symporter, GPH family [Arenibacter nanhaiticus]
MRKQILLNRSEGGQKNTTSAKQVGLLEKIGYGLGDTAGNFVYQSVLLLLGFFYTEVYGLDTATVASIFLVVRVVDAITDPLMGALVDRTNTQWGKYRPYLIILCVPYAIASVLVFTVPDFGPEGKVIYAYTTYITLMLLFTAINIPYGSMTGVMTSDPKERASINATRFMFATGGGLIVTSLVLPMTKLWENPAIGYRNAMILMAILSVVLFVICFLTTKERVKGVEVKERKSTVLKDLLFVVKNDQYRLVALATLLMVTAQTVKNTTQLYYITIYVEDAVKYSAMFLSVWMIGGMLGAQLASKLLMYVDKKKAYELLLYICAVASAASWFIGDNNIVMIMLLQFFVGFFNQMIAPIWFTFTADSVDYGELKFKRRIDGLTLSFTLFSLKLGLSIGGAIALIIMGYYGYKSGGIAQSNEAIQGILLVFSIVPAVIFIMTALIVRLFKLNSKTIKENALKLEILRAQ